MYTLSPFIFDSGNVCVLSVCVCVCVCVYHGWMQPCSAGKSHGCLGLYSQTWTAYRRSHTHTHTHTHTQSPSCSLSADNKIPASTTSPLTRSLSSSTSSPFYPFSRLQAFPSSSSPLFNCFRFCSLYFLPLLSSFAIVLLYLSLLLSSPLFSQQILRLHTDLFLTSANVHESNIFH